MPRFNLRFPGQVFDEESGLFYNYFRTYDPRTGTYIQNDWIGLEGGWNRKTYANNDPLSYIDPDGLNPVAAAYAGAGAGSAFGPVGTMVGGVVGAGIGAWIGWNVVGPMLAKPAQTPTEEEPGSCHVNPGSGQERKFGADGLPEYDIDWHADHGAGTPNGHNWDASPDGKTLQKRPWRSSITVAVWS